MAKRTSKSRSKSRNKKRSGGGRPPPRRRDGKAALRGMLIGALIFGGLAVAFLVPIAGATPFSHLIHALGLEGDEDDIRDVAAPGMPDDVVIDDKAERAAPLEDVSDDEQQGLDDLIDKKTSK